MASSHQEPGAGTEQALPKASEGTNPADTLIVDI